jgi:uncharacterized protein (TIGR03083 family)
MVGEVEYRELADAVEREIGALVRSVEAGPLAGPVPTCPGWSVRDLALHVGQFCGFWTHVLCEGTGRGKTPYPEEPEGDGMVEWLWTLGAHLVLELQATPSDTEVWTWYDADRSAKFVARRCANELAVHRYDAQSARGTCSSIATDLAADGIDEMLSVLTTARPRSGRTTGQTLHLHATDCDAEWLVTLHRDRIDFSRRHAKADFALRGAVSDLELALYDRPPIGELERFGDESVLEAWRGEFTF